MIAHPNLKLWTRFQDDVTDSSGTGNNGAVIGAPTYVAGIQGKAISLNGSSQAVEFGDPVGLRPTAQFSLCCWVKPAGAGSDGNGGNIVGKYGANGWILYTYSASTGNLYYQENATGAQCNVTCPIGEWHHIALVRESDTAKRIYKDGNLAYTYTTSSTITDSGVFQIGSYGSLHAINQPFNGVIDDFQYYNGIALPASDIKRIMRGLHPLSRS